MVDWSKVVEECKRICEETVNVVGVYPTLRELFYTLSSRNIIPHSKSSYKVLSRILSQMRYSGKFPFHYIRDTTRGSEYLERGEYYAEELSVEELKRRIMNYIESLTSYSINPWVDQKNRIVIVVEKEATMSMIKSLVQKSFPYGVYNIRYTRGYDSATDAKEVADIVKRIFDMDYNPVLLLFGDFDPSGEDIVRDFVNRVKMLSNRDFTWEKIAVTREQVEKYNLPCRPEDEPSIKRLTRDPRYKSWRYGLYRVELEALFNPEKASIAEELVRNAIEKYFDWETFKQKTLPRMVAAEEESKRVKEKMLNTVKKILET